MVASPGFNPAKTTTYVLQKKQCGITSFDTLVIHVPKSYPVIMPNDTIICLGDSLILKARDSCIWCSHGWNSGVNSMQINVAPQSTSSYTYYQKDSCYTTSKSVLVNIGQCYSPQIVAPNVFTPNEDGINDIWIPGIAHELSVSEYHLVIYDRWGLKIFETEKYKEGWGGHTTSGNKCQEGTYYYVISYIDTATRGNKSLKGFLTLLE